ncbi:MAG: DUF3320 domain-containing protein [Chloroflexi bacterium]|nr:DUF3320 domain-containing protein [Chloroflexota bacterium]MCI0650172.1 DUF3320 domain-containing protein [Chloroflexota bacterium]MCI0729517.1 DUF3320 domain-containing protein [Chloroflexota bacterium]
MNPIETQVNIAREELLDLSLRNTLINYRPLKSKGVEVIDERPEEVFRLLVSETRLMSFLPVPEKDEGVEEDQQEEVASGEILLKQPEEDNNVEVGIAERHTDEHLQTPYTSTNLQKRLLNTFYMARTYIEEQGVNVLYLALGMLQWYESSNSNIVRQAPLVLIPVELSRSNVRARFRIEYTEDDIGGNLSLRAKLRAEFSLVLPELSENEELNVQDYFDRVAQAIAPQPRWSVNRTAIALGFFSFGTFLMYNDLDANNWPKGTRPSAHPLLRALLLEGFHEPAATIGDEEPIDKYVSPQDNYQVVDADSSQTLAILDVKRGRNLVIQGPPGTGKSQTITNLIAEALGQDKTVLFVAEKMAALEVVKRRLDESGLGDACLELHSHKANKKAFLDELRRTLDLGRPKTRDYAADLQALIDNRDRLNTYSEAVNTPIDKSGVTPYQAFGELLHLASNLEGITTPRLDGQPMVGWSAPEFRQWLSRIEELQTLLGRMGIPMRHPFWGSRYHQAYLPTDRRDVQQACQVAGEAVHVLQQASAGLASQLKLPTPDTRLAAVQLSQAAQKILTAPPLEGVQIMAQEWLARATDIKSALDTGSQLSQLQRQHDQWLLPEAWSHDVLQIRKAYVAYGRKWWRFLSGTFRRAQNDLNGLSRSSLPKGLGAQYRMVNAILEAQRLQPILAQHEPLLKQLFGPRWQGLASEWEQLQNTASWITALYSQIKGHIFSPKLISYLATSPDFVALQTSVTTVENGLNAHAETIATVVERIQLDEKVRLGEGNTLLKQPFPIQKQALKEWFTQVDTLQDIVAYNQLANIAVRAGLGEMVKVASTWPEASAHLVNLFQRSWYEALVAQAMKERPILATFHTETHLYRIRQFCEADKLSFQINRTQLAHKHWQRLPRHTASGQLGVLLREFEKKRRHLPIRKLMGLAGNAIQTIKPVFMMSPLSIPMFLPPGTLNFDLIVFDEASQVRPVEAFGAILRGPQTVVVGDSRQLPPTNFFNQVLEVDEETESLTADLESVLGLFAAQGAPQRMLRWHYRSRHESLITVSNYEFYDNKLVVFPSPDAAKEEVGVVFHYLPDTAYDRGRSSTNEQEAQVVAKAVMDHARTRPDLTLGVAAFSIGQMQMIQDQLEILRRRDASCEWYFNAHPFEPFFVKNLENVQGDERDVIFISVGYGRTADGQISMNFGPLNKDGGERRLNVLITRARLRCEIFTNLTADDLDLNRTNARGIVALKRYLKYAETGRLDIPTASGGEPDSPFEEQVASALRQQGYEIATQVGSAGFWIDLAVKDKVQPGRYLLGIECDGATYHSARSARDRDRLRQEVLENMGWQIHRIWSTDWFRNPTRELRRAVKAIEGVKVKSPAGRPPSAMPPNSPPMSHKPIERHDAKAPAAAIRAQNYKIARLRIQTPYELHEVPPWQLADWIQEVVKVESPVHVDDVTRRIVDAARVKRTGNRIKTAIQEAIAYAVRSRTIQKRGNFLWDKEMNKLQHVRSHANLPNFTRKIERIAPEEIMLAVQTVVKNGLGMRREAIPLATCTLLGFGRTSEDMRLHVEKLIDKMISQRQLIKRGDSLVVE